MPREEAAALESGGVEMHDERFAADAEAFFRGANETGVEYFACGGTLLGAIRHGRLLCWDDDCDISVHRRDFARFLRLLALPPSFRVRRTLFGAVASTANITIDVFVVDQVPWRRGQLAFSGPYCNGFASFFTSSVFHKDCHPSSEIYPTKTARLGGVRVRVPAESERVLKRVYGETCLRVARLPPAGKIKHGPSASLELVAAGRVLMPFIDSAYVPRGLKLLVGSACVVAFKTVLRGSLDGSWLRHHARVLRNAHRELSGRPTVKK